jgi:hypothetical protein
MIFRFVLFFFLLIAVVLSSCLFSPPSSNAQSMSTASSEHVLMRLPLEREALGRELIGDLERCYLFMNGVTGGKLPRRILLLPDWDQVENSWNLQEAKIIIGINRPSTAVNQEGYLVHAVAREMGRLGLLQLSGGAEREDNDFLFEGMIEILARESTNTSRNLEGAWVIAQLLDQKGQLGLDQQRPWSVFSEGRRSFRSAAPGITFLTTFRELQGRDRAVKFFETLKRSSLAASLAIAFKAPVAELEKIWLKRVRDYQAPDEITTTANDVPQLVRTVLVPETCQPGNSLEIQLFIKDAGGNLFSDGVFLKDGRTGKILQVRMFAQKSAESITTSIILPVDANCPPGEYKYQIIAVDEVGNLRRWDGDYRVLAP